MKQLIECVPNFSEGNDLNIIRQITDTIEKTEGVRVIDVDPGKATNRTVVTMVGSPEEVIEAAFQAVKKARELIDMRHHKGAHPRFGATDVCPLIPVSNITMEETVVYAQRLAERIGRELNIPVYCYESAAREAKRKNLANCRAGEYEGLKEKISNTEWQPDFGPNQWSEDVARSGATAVGARNFLVAYNVNLNSTSTRRANSIAFDVREKGRVKREGNPLTGKIVLDEKGNKVWEPGMLKSVKAIGWFIEEFGIAQISMNLTDINVTSMHEAYEAVYERANARGLRVTGSELVGVVPLKAMLDAGKYFLHKQQRSIGISDREIIKIAVKSLGLNELYPFDPDKKIIEYILAKEDTSKKLIDMKLNDFVHETASESPAPGGGSISAYMGALGAALGTMVANLSAHKKGWDERWEEFSIWAEKGKLYHDQLLRLVDEDTNAFNKIMDAFGLPKGNEAEKAARSEAIKEATIYAIKVPFEVMEASLNAMFVMKAMAEIGNPNSVSDAGVGALAARSAVLGAYLNVQINASSYKEDEFVKMALRNGKEMVARAQELEAEILEIVQEKIS